MKLEVNISKRYAFVIIGLLIVLVGLVGIQAYTKELSSIPDPGHPLSSIQGYFQGDANLESTLDKFCQSDGTNCQGFSSAVVYDTGWFAPRLNNWLPFGDFEVMYSGSANDDGESIGDTTYEYQHFRIRENFNASSVVDARLLIKDKNDGSRWQDIERSLDCIVFWHEWETAQGRPHIYCKELRYEEVPYSQEELFGTLSSSSDEARLIIEYLP